MSRLSMPDPFAPQVAADDAVFDPDSGRSAADQVSAGIARRDRAAYRLGGATPAPMITAPAAAPIPATAAPVSTTTPAPTTAAAPTTTASAATSARVEPALAEHLVGPTSPTGDAAPERTWAIWRWIGLRGTGFGIDRLVALGSPDCVGAAERVIELERVAAQRKWAVVGWLRGVLAEATGDRRAVVYRASRLARKGRYDDLAEEFGRSPLVAAARAAAEEHTAAEQAYQAAFVDATHRLAATLHELSGDPRLREAVAWQNPRALHTAIDALRKVTADPTTPRNTSYRRWESLVVSYLQRYCAKNDTIGFFGPVGWASVVDQDSAILVRPGPDLLDNRDVYLENWAVHELAQAMTTDELRPWVAPRRMPFVDVADGALQVPLTPQVPLSPLSAAVLRACDGVRTARELAADVLADPELGCADPAEVYRVLEDFRQQRRIAWSLEVPPAELVPQRAVRRQLDAVRDAAVRAPAEAAIAELEAGRDEIAVAAGDPDRLAAGVIALQETFTRLTGTAAVRRPGEFYAGRTLVHEECRRDCAVTLSPALLDTLWPSLGLLLESARWYTSAAAALYRRALLDVYRERSAATGTRVLRFADFWLWANDTIFRLDPRLVGRLTRTLQERWASVLGIGDELREDVHRNAADLRAAALAAFAAPRPGWHTAIQHSPDVMIAAASEDAIRAGEFTWVLGELHPGVNSVRAAVFASQHSDLDRLRRAMAADLGGPRIVLGETREQGGAPQRLADTLVGADDLYLVFGHDTCGVDPQRALPVAALLIEEVDGRLVVRSRDGRHRAEIVELLADALMGRLVQEFKPLPQRRYSPRITIDRLVVSRRSWSLAPADLAFAYAADEPQRFLIAQRWRMEHGMPRHLFVKSPAEHKPVYVDLSSVPSVELFAHAVRAMERADPAYRMGIGEMLPGPDELWLTDAAGTRYTAEFRMVAVDRRGRNGGAQ